MAVYLGHIKYSQSNGEWKMADEKYQMKIDSKKLLIKKSLINGKWKKGDVQCSVKHGL